MNKTRVKNQTLGSIFSKLYCRYDFIAFPAGPFQIAGINAFIMKLNEEYGCNKIKGIVVYYSDRMWNKDDAFPEFADIDMIRVCGKGEPSIIALIIRKIGMLCRRDECYSPLFILAAGGVNYKIISRARLYTNRAITWVYLAHGIYTSKQYHFHRYFIPREIFARVIGVRIMDFELMKKNSTRILYNNCKWYKKVFEEDNCGILKDENNPYVIYIGTTENEKTKEVSREVMELISSRGYKVYIKAHPNHMNDEIGFDGLHSLPSEYSIESIVGGAKRKPNMLIGWDSNAMITCSIFWDIPSLSLLELYIPDAEKGQRERSIQIIDAIEKGSFPNVRPYSEKYI